MRPADALAAYALGREVERDFERHYAMPLGEFAVLHALADTPTRRMRMIPLARAAALSPSGFTRMSRRLARKGQIVFGEVTHDGRGTYIVLTATGYEAWKRVWHVPDHAEAETLSGESAGA